MSLCSYLKHISVSLADPAHSKKKVLETVARILEKESKIDAKSIFEKLLEREKIGSTGLGKGVALPHCRVAGIDAPLICLLRTRIGIDYGAPDGLPVSLFFALLIPEKDNAEYLELVAELAQKLDRPECISKLQKVSSTEQIIETLKE